jgi:hypothetical protein
MFLCEASSTRPKCEYQLVQLILLIGNELGPRKTSVEAQDACVKRENQRRQRSTLTHIANRRYSSPLPLPLVCAFSSKGVSENNINST